jgi:hypothetical protein
MRGPWHSNPSPYVTRFGMHPYPQLPGCHAYQQWFGISDFVRDKKMSLLQYVQEGPHGLSHSVIGGTYGCDALQQVFTDQFPYDAGAASILCYRWGHVIKALWRARFMITYTPEQCRDNQACSLHCIEPRPIGPMKEKLFRLLRDLKEAHGWNDDMYGRLAESICDISAKGLIHVGDHATSTNAYDPSFWVIHPAVERAYHAKLMAGSPLKDTYWPTFADMQANPTITKLCSQIPCYEDGIEGEWELCCQGHYEHDAMFDFVNGIRDLRVSSYGATNRQVLDWTNVTSSQYTMTYLYDNFVWPHCHVELGESRKSSIVLGP